MTERALRAGKARDAATALPLFGVFLLMPPVIALFAQPADPFGIPLLVLYVFGVWAGLICCAFVLARRLRRVLPIEEEAGNEDGRAGI